MVKICRSPGNRLIEGWNDNQLSELEGGRGDCAAKSGAITSETDMDINKYEKYNGDDYFIGERGIAVPPFVD